MRRVEPRCSAATRADSAPWPAIVIALGWSLAAAQDRRESEAALTAVRKEIKALQDRIARETTRRDEGVARAARGRGRGRRRRRASSPQFAPTCSGSKRRAATSRRKASERIAGSRPRRPLSHAQVRSTYMTGREELFKLLLSQESPATLGRMLVYFDYYNRARVGAHRDRGG